MLGVCSTCHCSLPLLLPLFSPNHLGVSRDDKAKDAETATCRTTKSKNGHHQLTLVVCLLVSSILGQFGPRTVIAYPRVRYLKNNETKPHVDTFRGAVPSYIYSPDER